MGAIQAVLIAPSRLSSIIGEIPVLDGKKDLMATAPQAPLVCANLTQRVLWYALCVVLLWLFMSPLLFHDTFFQMGADETHYVWKAEGISHDLDFLANERAWRRHPPLIPLIIGLLAKVMPIQVAVLIITKTLAVFGIVMVYVLGVQLKGPIAGMVAAVLLAANPTYRVLSNKPLLDIPLMILIVSCAWFLLRGSRYRVWAVATGILAIFVKDYGVLVLAYAVACIAWDFLIDRGWRPAAVAGTALALSTVTIAPLGYVLGHIPCCDWFAWFDWLAKDAQYRLWNVLDSSGGWMVPGVQNRYLALFLLLAIPLLGKMLSYSPMRMNVILLAWIVAILGPFLFASSGERRVILLFAPAIYLIVGVCVAQGLRLVRSPAMARTLFAVLSLGCVFLLFLAQRNPEVLYYAACRFRAYYPTGEWIRQNVPRSGSSVFTRSSHQVRFYANTDFEKDGGILYGEDEWTGIPQTVGEFQRVLDDTDKTAYLIVDIEEKSDPHWLYPPDRQAAEAILGLGFEVVHTVWVPVGERCDIPDWPYYSKLPGFLNHLGLPLYRNFGAAKERVDAVIFQRTERPPR